MSGKLAETTPSFNRRAFPAPSAPDLRRRDRAGADLCSGRTGRLCGWSCWASSATPSGNSDHTGVLSALRATYAVYTPPPGLREALEEEIIAAFRRALAKGVR